MLRDTVKWTNKEKTGSILLISSQKLELPEKSP